MNKQMIETIKKVEEWAEERNIIRGGTIQGQFIKLVEEFGKELFPHCTESNKRLEAAVDARGDCLVLCTVISKQAGTSLVDGLFSSDCLTIDEGTFEQSRGGISAVGDLAVVLLGALADSIARNKGDIATKTCEFAQSIALMDLCCDQAESSIVHAYDQIKDRKGIMHDGVFVKSTDPEYERVKALVEASKC